MMIFRRNNCYKSNCIDEIDIIGTATKISPTTSNMPCQQQQKRFLRLRRKGSVTIIIVTFTVLLSLSFSMIKLEFVYFGTGPNCTNSLLSSLRTSCHENIDDFVRRKAKSKPTHDMSLLSNDNVNTTRNGGIRNDMKMNSKYSIDAVANEERNNSINVNENNVAAEAIEEKSLHQQNSVTKKVKARTIEHQKQEIFLNLREQQKKQNGWNNHQQFNRQQNQQWQGSNNQGNSNRIMGRNPPISGNNNNRNVKLIRKPQLVIHVGPGKTATTTIQETMTQWYNNEQSPDMNVLALDNYVYLGAYFNSTWKQIDDNEKMILEQQEIENLTNQSDFDQKHRRRMLRDKKDILRYKDFTRILQYIKDTVCHKEMNGIRRKFAQEALSLKRLQMKENQMKTEKLQNSAPANAGNRDSVTTATFQRRFLQHQPQSSWQDRRKFTKNASSLHDRLMSLQCARNLVDYLLPYANDGKNVLISDETISSMPHAFFAASGTNNGIRLNPYKSAMDWDSLYEILNPHWNITVIVAYRRYNEWLLSAKQQMERTMEEYPAFQSWPSSLSLINNNTKNNHSNDESESVIDGSMSSSTEETAVLAQGESIEPLFPDFWKRHKVPGEEGRHTIPFHYTDYLFNSIEQINDRNSGVTRIHTVLYNIHATQSISSRNSAAKTSIRTIFVCDAMPHMNNVCQYSRELDRNRIPDARENQHDEALLSAWYNQLATAAAAAGMINTSRHDRTSVNKLVKQHHQKLLSKQLENERLDFVRATANSDNVTQKYEFPISCPSDEELNEYLSYSLSFEETLLPAFYTNGGGKQRHISDFWHAAHEKQSYCSIDTKATLQQSYWKTFFGDLP